MSPYQAIANAVVEQAVKDYRQALKAVSLNSRNREAKAIVSECEAFFRSDWYGVLTGLDGEMLMAKIREETEV
jgi:hypothetical protein